MCYGQSGMIESLLRQAEELLHQDLEDSMKLADAFPYFPTDEMRTRYTNAMELFEKALEQDPTNRRAVAGREACHEMLTPIHAIQHLGGPTMPDPPEPEPNTPWDKLRSRRKEQSRAIQYTGEAFSDSGEKYRHDVEALLTRAREAVAKGSSTEEILEKTALKLADLQEEAHRCWKGHGPEFLEEALSRLRSELGPD